MLRVPRDAKWRTKDGRILTIGEMADSHLNNAILAALRNDGTVYVSRTTLKRLCREQLRRWLGPWSTTIKDLMQAVIDGQKCEFALHDALCEEGYPTFAALVMKGVLVLCKGAVECMLEEDKVIPFMWEWGANHAKRTDLGRNERKLRKAAEAAVGKD